MKNRQTIVVLLALCFSMPVAALASNFNTIVAFGDSLSDNGNLYAISPADCPAEKYYQGRFSNGPVWLDYLADSNNLNATLIDNAYGGAETSSLTPPGLVEQVAAYIGTSALSSHTLFTIWIGGNDFLGGSSDFEASADNVRTALDLLAAFGADSILVLNLPDLGAIPRNNGDDATSAVATVLTEGYNAELKDRVDAFKADNPQVSVYYMDIFSLFNDIIAHPGTYGLSNVDSICPNFLVDNEFDNDGYLFWDDIHPTTEAHEEIAVRVTTLVSPGSDSDSGDSGGGCFISAMAMGW